MATDTTGSLRRNEDGDLLGDLLFCAYPMPDLQGASLPSLNYPLPTPPYTAPPGTTETGTDSQVTFSQATGYLPARKDAADKPETKAYLDKTPNARTAFEQLKVTAVQDFARVFIPGGGARIGAGLDRITTGGEDVKTVFAGLQDETAKIYKRDIEPKL